MTHLAPGAAANLRSDGNALRLPQFVTRHQSVGVVISNGVGQDRGVGDDHRSPRSA